MSNTSTNNSLLEFARLHTGPYESHAPQIGLTAAQAQEYKVATEAAGNKQQAALAARQAAKAATQEQNEAFTTLRRLNASYLRLIRGFAEQSADPAKVYILAELPPPGKPGPVQAPNAPFDLTADLAIAQGGISVRWKATQPKGVSGVVYVVERAIGAQQNWTSIGLTGTKSLVDASLPAGTSRVFYRVTAQRGTLSSTGSTVLDIRLGTGPGEAMTVSTVRLAA
jgi:hypothetical protein